MTFLRRARVFLAHSFFLRHDEKQLRKMKPYPPLATLIAAAVLREEGYEVRLFDAMLASGLDAYEHALDDAEPDIVAIVEDNFNFITKMCTVRMREDALAMVRAARARGCAVAVNGSDATDHPTHYLAAGAHAVIVGEVEPTLRELVHAWAARQPRHPMSRAGGRRVSPWRAASLDDVAGLVLPSGTAMSAKCGVNDSMASAVAPPSADREPGSARRAGSAHGRRTAPRPYLEDLDALPLPAWDLVDVAAYRTAWTRAHGRFSWNAVTSRGCPYGCNWCAKPIWGRRYAQRSPRSVAVELERLREHAAPDHVWFADDIFGLTPAWIESFAEAVAERDARVPFMMQSRVNLMTARTVAALAAAGAEEVWVGVESGSQAVLDAMDKHTRLDQIRAGTRALKAKGIRCGWFVMLGYPGEEWRDVLRTRDLIREEAPDDLGVSVAYPLPGTVFHERVRAQLSVQRNWRETDDLAVLFEGRYSSSFYRHVRDVLHAEVPGAAIPDRAALDARWAELERLEPGARQNGATRRRPPAAVTVDRTTRG